MAQNQNSPNVRPESELSCSQDEPHVRHSSMKHRKYQNTQNVSQNQNSPNVSPDLKTTCS